MGLLDDAYAYWGDKAKTLAGLLQAGAESGASAYAGATKPYTKEQAKTIGGLLADFTPVVGGVKGTIEEAHAGNPGWAAFNAATVPLDLATLGGGTALKGLLAGLPAMAGIINKMNKPIVKLPYQIDHKPMTIDGGAASLHDLLPSFGDDIYSKNALQYYGSGNPLEKEILRVMQSVRGNPDAMVTIYRGVPQHAENINPGDWVTLSKKAAEYYTDPAVVGGKDRGKILEMKVPAKHITSWPDSLLEFGYYP